MYFRLNEMKNKKYTDKQLEEIGLYYQQKKHTVIKNAIKEGIPYEEKNESGFIYKGKKIPMIISEDKYLNPKVVTYKRTDIPPWHESLGDFSHRIDI